MTADYLKDGQAEPFLEFAAEDEHSGLQGLWSHILTKYFTLEERFLAQPERVLPDGKRADITLVRLRTGEHARSTIIIVEIKPAHANDTWDNILSQAFNYIKTSGLQKRVNPTIGIAAKGLEFMPFEVPGSSMDSGYKPIKLGVNNDGTTNLPGVPYHVIDNSDALQVMLLQAKEKALSGHYADI